MRSKTIPHEYSEELYRYIWGICKNRNSKLLRINGIENHIHLLVDIHPSIALSSFCGELKRTASLWLKSNPKFPYFVGWGKEYYGFSVSQSHKNYIVEYIKNQRTHHSTLTFEDEMKRIFNELGIEWNDNKLT